MMRAVFCVLKFEMRRDGWRQCPLNAELLSPTQHTACAGRLCARLYMKASLMHAGCPLPHSLLTAIFLNTNAVAKEQQCHTSLQHNLAKYYYFKLFSNRSSSKEVASQAKSVSSSHTDCSDWKQNVDHRSWMGASATPHSHDFDTAVEQLRSLDVTGSSFSPGNAMCLEKSMICY